MIAIGFGLFCLGILVVVAAGTPGKKVVNVADKLGNVLMFFGMTVFFAGITRLLWTSLP